MTTPPVRLGIIGLGAMGARVLQIATTHPEYTVVAAADLDASAVSRYAEQHPSIHFTTTPEEVIAADVDAVYIATPPASHADLTEAAFTAGHAVFCEKPLSISLADGQRMLDAAAASGRAAAVNFALSDRRATLYLEELLHPDRQGQAGEVRRSREAGTAGPAGGAGPAGEPWQGGETEGAGRSGGPEAGGPVGVAGRAGAAELGSATAAGSAATGAGRATSSAAGGASSSARVEDDSRIGGLGVGEVLAVEIRLAFPQWPRAFQVGAGWLGERAQGGFIREVFSHFAYLTDRLIGPLTPVELHLEHRGPGSEVAAFGLYRAGDVPVQVSGVVAGPTTYEWIVRGSERSYLLRDWQQLFVAEGKDWVPVPLPGERGGEETRLSLFAEAVRGHHPANLADFATAYRVQQAVEAWHTA
ncbi:Gfo/Idh/MocA family protein [Kribbella lupini]|uniref:Gfo/Idh/MocA-like oxidoreductase N-terminal domain-containing protein n=1 Tax=Kribbella lupini TaxID=291602 RepID=A0ABN2A0G2_9ACTN